MRKYNKYEIAEAVGKGHPDKIADQISDAVLDVLLEQDKNSKVAIETLVSKNLIVLAGEITSLGNVNYSQIVAGVINPLGYNIKDFKLEIDINKQSLEIKESVEFGAGDQGFMVGYAVNNPSTNHMPWPHYLANVILEMLEKLRITSLPVINADMKCQVTMNNSVISKIIVAIHHQPILTTSMGFKKYVTKKIARVIKNCGLNTDYILEINANRQFTIGGLNADTGLTGRKIVVDSYGNAAKVGGGAFSGKDGSKMDRTGAYAARWIAKTIVCNKWAEEVTIQLSYEMGKSRPVSIAIDCFGTEKIGLDILQTWAESLDLTPQKLISQFNLKQPFAKKVSVYGHFGKYSSSWEQVELVKIKK